MSPSNSLRTRLLGFVGGGIAFLIFVASVAVYQLKSNIDAYNKLISVNIAHEQQLNQINYSFKVQVQEWKNLLLRGKDPSKYQKYWDEFQRLQADIQDKSRQLLDDMPQDDSRKLVQDFTAAHSAAFQKYQDGAKAFTAANFDHTAGDNAVTGIDREPSRLLTEAANAINQKVSAKTKEANSESSTVVFWSETLVILCGVAVLGLVWVAIQSGLIAPLSAINRQLQLMADGNFREKLHLQHQGEIGELNASINRLQHSIIEIVDTLKQSSASLAGSSRQLSSTSEEIALTSSTAHSATDQVATAVNEMSSTVQEVARNASSAADAANQADHSAREGLKVMEATLGAISQLSQEVENVSGAMVKLETETGRIGSVLDVIKSVAEQTNLLALNAAIEAARAGDQGRGFAVVADEVRSLAQRTQQSTEEIQQIIEALQNNAAQAMLAMRSSQSKTQSTLELAGRTGTTITSITAAVAQIHSMNTQIATAAEEQSHAAEEINRNVIRIVDVVQSTSNQASKSAQIASSLDANSQKLAEQITHFSV